MTNSIQPRRETLWRGAILSGIAIATKTAEDAHWAAFAGWHRNHYILNGVDGREGVVTFAGGHWLPDAPLVGVFHDVHSERRPLRDPRVWVLERFFQGCPKSQRLLAERAGLPYL